MERYIGIDVGYGFVKITDGHEGYVFPSVVGDGSVGTLLRTSLQPPGRTDDIRLTVDGRTYNVGTLAIRQSRMAYRSLSTTRSEGNDLKVLFLAALSLFSNQPLNGFAAVTGLPPGRMHLTDELIRVLKGEHRVIRHRGTTPEELVIRVDRLAVVPQPMGAFWSQALDSRGQVREDSGILNGRTGVLDVGFRTTDLVSVEDGEYVTEASKTIPIGLATAYEEIASRLLVEHGLERETYAMDDAVIRGETSVAGRRVDITHLREQAFDILATKVLVEVRSAWQLTEYDRIVLTGGGGQALSRYLLPHLSQGLLLSESVTANSRGYLAWAHRLWNPAPSAWNEGRSALA